MSLVHSLVYAGTLAVFAAGVLIVAAAALVVSTTLAVTVSVVQALRRPTRPDVPVEASLSPGSVVMNRLERGYFRVKAG